MAGPDRKPAARRSGGPRGAEPRRSTGESRDPRSTRPAQRMRFALLCGGSAPPDEISLIESLEEQEALRHRFVPLADAMTGRLNVCLGLIPVSDDRHVQRLRTASVHRGRVGGKKPDQLLALQAAPDDFAAWPRVKREGLARAALRQGIALNTDGQQSAPAWWLALEFALNGYAQSAEFRGHCTRFEAASTVPPEQALKAAGRLVATEYLTRSAEAVTQRSGKAARKNPFWQGPDLAHVMEWQDGLDPALAAMVLDQYKRVPESANAGAASLNAHDRQVAELVFDRVTAEEPVLLQRLQEDLQGSLHVLAWLIEAHQLIVSPYGVLFERSQLYELLRKLPKTTKTLAEIPGTGELRALGIGRRKAEALRDVLTAWPWLLEAARKPVGSTRAGARGGAKAVRKPGRGNA